MPADNSLHKAAHKGDLDECRKYIEGTDGEDAIDVNEPGTTRDERVHMFVTLLVSTRRARTGRMP